MIVQSPNPITNLVLASLSQNVPTGLSDVLRKIADALHAVGCILWQVAPGADLEADPARGRLFVLADWFSDQRHDVRHDLPIDKSITGKAVLTQTAINIQDVETEAYLSQSDSFLSQGDGGAMCAVPVTFETGEQGAINVYRKLPGPFTEEEVLILKELASLLPTLYSAIRDKITLNLLLNIQNQFSTDYFGRGLATSREEAIRILREISGLVADAFQCVETSIFLEDPRQSAKLYQLMATTWPTPLKKLDYHRGDEGLTGWVLEHKKPIKIFDLAHFERDKELIQREYEGLNWVDKPDIKSTVRQILGLKAKEKVPPLSFMAVPIVKGDKIYGVIRCSVAHSSTYYFAEREVILLQLVAEQISHFWSNWLARGEAHDENETWRDLVESIKELNSYVYRELTREAPDERRIFAEALCITSLVLKGAEIIDVRLLDDSKRCLYFAEPHGDAWKEGTPEEIEERMKRRYSVTDKPPGSAGAYVFQTGQARIMPDVKTDEYYSELFPATKRMIIAPIKVEDKNFGVLDIRGVGEQDFPLRAASIAELIGQQLGMYSFLAGTIGELRGTKADLSVSVTELQSLQKQQIQIFQDLSHQFKTPITQAHAHVQLALSEVTDERLKNRLWAIRGLCSKAKRVSYNTELFSALARDQAVTLRISMPLKRGDLIRLLIEAAKDTEFLSWSRDIQFQVETESLDRSEQNSPVRELRVDRNLLEQAVTVILDNAAKYSYRNTVVRISAGQTRSGGFYISIANQGLPIHSREVQLCCVRGWRGEAAQHTSGEGSGIGLWIVDHIMRAHGGQLMILPTQNGVTQISLVFPSSRVS